MNIHARSLLYNTDNLDSTSKAILLTLITYCHGDKDACYPSTRDIAKMSGYAKRTIRKHLRILEGKDFVKTTKEKERKTHRYQILGLYGVQTDSGTGCLQSNNPEGLQENTYEPTGGRFDGIKPPKASGVCDLRHSGRKNRSQSQAISGPKATVAESQSQNKASVRFEGQLTTQKIVEIYNFYSRHGWIRRCYDSFFTFVANCLMIKRLRKRNVYGYLTWIYKKKFDRKLITAKDEELAKRELKLIQDNGLMPDLMEPQPSLQRDNPEAPVPPPPTPPPTARSTSRPAMDWHIKNLPEVGKEAALAKKVEHRQLTHVHPSWMENLNCWMVKVRKVDGKRFYEQQNLTPDGWFEVTGMSEIVPLINSESKRISQASFIEILASGFFASDPTLPAT